MTPDDIARLRALLQAVPGLNWSHGAQSGAIETSQPDGVHGRTMFIPADGDEVNSRAMAHVDASIIAEAQLACAAVNALPSMIATIERLRRFEAMAVASCTSNECAIRQRCTSATACRSRVQIAADYVDGKLKHNHVTRDIKAPGECPSCDGYHARSQARAVRPKPEQLHITDDDIAAVIAASGED